MTRRVGAAFLAFLLAVAPARALADIRLLVPAVASSSSSVGAPATLPSAVFNQLVTNAPHTGNSSVTFGSTPATGDYLIAIGQDNAGALSVNTGWTFVTTTCGGAPYGNGNIVGYHVVVSGDGTTYTPFTNGGAGQGGALAVLDVKTGLGTWAALYGGLACNNLNDNAAPITVSSVTSQNNTSVFAIGMSNATVALSAAPTLSGSVLGNLHSSYDTSGGSGTAVAAAFNGGFASFATISEGVDPGSIGGFSGVTAILIFLNPG